MPSRDRGLIINPHTGAPENVPVLQLSEEDARLLRLYKKFLLRYGLRESLWCNTCWEGNLDDGAEAHVTDTQIVIKCRCQLRTFMGPTF